MAGQVHRRRRVIPDRPGAGTHRLPVSDKLTASDRHYCPTRPEIVKWLSRSIPAEARVLEVGPGHDPFHRADEFVDFVAVDVPQGHFHRCDLATEKLPFPDKSFDFVVCKHTLEDMYDPFPLCAEMSRVAKAGYVETPSPVAELCRGVDGITAPIYRGYHHHRFVVWPVPNELRFVSKYPIVEYLDFSGDEIAERLRAPKYWNTYHLWDGELKVRHIQSPLDYDIPSQYRAVLGTAIMDSVAATDTFWAAL